MNGGRINATIGGNTAGAGALVSSGTMTLVGGNNVTLSQAGNAITISGAAAAAVGSNTLGMSNLGNTSGTTGVISGSALRYNFAGGNNITLSQSINGASGTVTISAASQTVQTQNRFNLTLSGNTSGVMAQVSSGTLTLAGGNNVTLSQNGNAVTVSAANQTVQTQNLQNVTLSGNTAGVMAQISSGTLSLAGGNNITLSQNGNAVSIIGGAGGGGGGIAVEDGANSISTGTARFSNSNGVSFGINGQTITASHNGITSQTNQTLGLFAAGNTTQNSSTALDARSLTFRGLGAVSVGYSNGSVQISGAAGGGGGGVALYDGVNNISSGTAQISGGGALTASVNGQTLSLNVPAVSSLSATGAVSISTNGSTISIGAPVVPSATLSRWEYMEGFFTALSTNINSSLSINHMYMPFNVTGSAMKIGGSMTVGTSTGAATGSINISLWMGLYTLNGSTLSLASSGSANNGFSWQAASTATTALTGVTGMRQLTVPMNVNATPGEYWVGAVIASATTATGATYTVWGNSQIASAAGLAVLTPIGSATSNANRDAMLLQGLYIGATTAGPTSMVGSNIQNTVAGNVMRANFYNVIYNATY